jgi:hypothetical protein
MRNSRCRFVASRPSALQQNLVPLSSVPTISFLGREGIQSEGHKQQAAECQANQMGNLLLAHRGD